MEPKEIFHPLSVGAFCGRCRSCPTRERECPQTSEDCTSGNDPLYGRSLAMVYSPVQGFDDLYEPEEGLLHGTIFVRLDKPFLAGGRMC